MPDETDINVHEEEETISPISKLIWEVSQQPVLYDSENPLYKDNAARQTAWHYIAKQMKMPATDCQIKWGTLRRCLANARKRQMKKQAGGSKYIKKWRYQDEMSFLLPFVDHREYDYLSTPSRRKKPQRVSSTSFDYDSSGCVDPLGQNQEIFISEEYEQTSETDDTQLDVKPSSEKLHMYVVGSAVAQPGDDRHQPASLMSTDEMYIEEDEIENIPLELESLSTSRITYQKRVIGGTGSSSSCGGGGSGGGGNSSSNSGSGGRLKSREIPGEIVLDEMDSFFLSMSKALKKLPRVEQINVRSQVYTLVTRAEINWLQKPSSSSSSLSPPPLALAPQDARTAHDSL